MSGDTGKGRDSEKPQDRRVHALMKMEEQSHHGPDHQHVREVNFIAVASEPTQKPSGSKESAAEATQYYRAPGAQAGAEKGRMIERCARLKTLLQRDEQQGRPQLQRGYVEANFVKR